MRYNDPIQKNEECLFFNRLKNYNFIKFAKMNNLSQKMLLEESKEHTYFPKINNFSHVMKYYNNYNSQSSLGNKSQKIIDNYIIKKRKDKIRLLRINEEEKNHMMDNPINNSSKKYKNKIPIPINMKKNSNYQKTYSNVEFKFDKITKAVNKKLINELMNKSSASQNDIFQNNSKTPITKKKFCSYKNISSILNDSSLNKNSRLEHRTPKSILNDFLPKNNKFIPRSESSLFFGGIKKRRIKSTINYQVYDNKFNFIDDKNNKKIDSLYKRNSVSTYNNSICLNEVFEQYSNSNQKNSKLNYLLFPSKTNSINLTIDNLVKEKNNENNKNNKNKENKEKNLVNKKIILKKLSNIELKKYKIFNNIKLKKKLKSNSSSKLLKKNSYIIDNKNNTDNKEKNIKIKNNVAKRNLVLFNDSNQQKESGTTMQTMTDEKMMNIANNYLDKDDMVNKNLIDDILSCKKNK